LFVESGSIHIDQTLFSNNLVLGGLGFDVAGYAQYGNGMGGAVYNANGQIEILDSAMVSNQANGGSLPEGCCNFSIPRAGDGSGGAVYNQGVIAMINSTLAGNSAEGGAGEGAGICGVGYGGAIFNAAQTMLLNVTAANNLAMPAPKPVVDCSLGFRGGQLYLKGGSIVLTNTILSSLTMGETNVVGTVVDGGHNISSDGSALFTMPSSKNSVDPVLAPLADNGGFTPTLALLFGSPAIGAGDPASCPPTDQRGVARPTGSGCDIGAFEFSPTVSLTRLAGGTVRINYQFEAGITNRISGSTNLTKWVFLETEVSDANGRFQWEDSDSINVRTRFYRIQEVQPGGGE
jgi:hypothetical protein